MVPKERQLWQWLAWTASGRYAPVPVKLLQSKAPTVHHATPPGVDMVKQESFGMPRLSRRQAMKLASSFAAAFPLLNGGRSRAQVKPGAAAAVFEMADFTKAAPDADAAFAKALAAISKSAGEANNAGKPVPIVSNPDENATYKIKQPLLF